AGSGRVHLPDPAWPPGGRRGDLPGVDRFGRPPRRDHHRGVGTRTSAAQSGRARGGDGAVDDGATVRRRTATASRRERFPPCPGASRLSLQLWLPRRVEPEPAGAAALHLEAEPAAAAALHLKAWNARL